MIAEHRHLVQQGAQLVELRLDYINGDVNLKRLLADRPCPAIVTIRRAADGGKWGKDEETRRLLLRTAIAEGVEYVDLEEDVATSIPRYGPTKRIISLHDFRRTPNDLPAIGRRLADLDPDVVKLATMANSPHDNLRMMRLIRDSQIPTVGICMGEIGTPSRLLCGRFGAPFSYCTFHHERTLAPGQLSFEQMHKLYQYDRIGPETVVYGVIADPIKHSLSPVVHNAALQHDKADGVYIPFRVPRDDLKQFLADCEELGIRGLSVTIPHKEAVLESLTKVDGAIRGIGAANTIVFDGDQRLGYNTDYRAAMNCLEEALGVDGDQPNCLAERNALVLGAGGVAKAIVFGLRRRGAQVAIASRTPERAGELARLFDCRVVPWQSRHGTSAEILINCTPIGMHPDVDATPFERHSLKPSMLVFDTVYNPETTLLIKNARSQSCRTVSGLSMFVAQAVRQYKLLTGREIPPEIMRDAVRRTIGPARLK